MKRYLQTTLVALFVILVTTGFAFASQSIAPGLDMPYFHIGCMIMGGLVIVSLKQRYEKMHLAEAIGSFALYALLVTIFTPTFVEALKALIS
jgi:uncharacterized YccA/Bax inhibitor family protein